MTDKTTDQLKDIVRDVFRDELKDEFIAENQRAIEETLKKADVVTQHDVDQIIAKRMAPLENKVAELESVATNLGKMNTQITDILGKLTTLDHLTARLSGVMSIIEEWPDDSRQKLEHDRRQDARITTNELAITNINSNVQTALVGMVDLRRDFMGDPNNPDHPNVMRDFRVQMTGTHAQVMQRLDILVRDVTTLIPMVQANTTFRENRRQIEKAVLASGKTVYRLVKDLWDDRKWWIVGGAVASGALAVVSNPDVQDLIEQIIANWQ